MDDASVLPQQEQNTTIAEQKLHNIIFKSPLPEYQKRLIESDAIMLAKELGRTPTTDELHELVKNARVTSKHGRADKGKHTHAAMIKAKSKRKAAKKSRQRNRGN